MILIWKWRSRELVHSRILFAHTCLRHKGRGAHSCVAQKTSTFLCRGTGNVKVTDSWVTSQTWNQELLFPGIACITVSAALVE